MRPVTHQAPGQVRVDERPESALQERGDAIIAITASGICGSDLHIDHGRVKIEPGFTIGHEFAGAGHLFGGRGMTLRPCSLPSRWRICGPLR